MLMVVGPSKTLNITKEQPPVFKSILLTRY